MADLVAALLFAINTPSMQGVYNAVSPFPVTNAEFTEKLGKVLKQPALLTIPSFVLKLLFGEGAQILLEGQRVLPERLGQAGFTFRYPTLQSALIRIY
jgi:NAD dependent epimerase/dehydratase family enzyme